MPLKKKQIEDSNTTIKKGISFDQIHKAAMLYLSLPLLCFFCFFLRWYYAVICAFVLLFVLWNMLRERNGLEEQYQSPFFIQIKTVILVFAFSLLWTYLGGMSGYYYQSADWDCRNAVYFDLIQYGWPVIYSENGAALVYYFGHWLPPAVLGKTILKLTGSLPVAREVGRMALWLWSSLGVSIVILMIFRFLDARTKGKRIVSVFLFVFFSGMDLAGALIRNYLNVLLEPSVLHLEWWAPDFQYTSIMACLFWVFNQSIIPWIITLCFLAEKKPSNYVYYCVVCLLCGTLPCVGLAALMIVKAAGLAIEYLRQKEGKVFFRSLFSVRNLLSFFLLFPAIAAFILSANTASVLYAEKSSVIVSAASAEGMPESIAGQENSANLQTEKNAMLEPDIISSEEKQLSGQTTVASDEALSDRESIASKEARSSWRSRWRLELELIAFLFLEVGAYMLLTWVDHKKDFLFYALAASFILIPFIHVGKSYDFCMRASIPGIFTLMLYVNRFLQAHFSLKRKVGKEETRRILAMMLAVCFAIGMATPLVELYRGAYHVIESKSFYLENQRLMTFNEDHINNNFMCTYPEDHIFFQYLAR